MAVEVLAALAAANADPAADVFFVGATCVGESLVGLLCWVREGASGWALTVLAGVAAVTGDGIARLAAVSFTERSTWDNEAASLRSPRGTLPEALLLKMLKFDALLK